MYRVNLLRLGLSGCAQINGRDKLTIAEKAKLDGEYLKRQSYFVDIFILLKATLKIFKDESWLEDGIIKLGKVK
jgi:O-antigen biosynthesis protein WbqP